MNNQSTYGILIPLPQEMGGTRVHIQQTDYFSHTVDLVITGTKNGIKEYLVQVQKEIGHALKTTEEMR